MANQLRVVDNNQPAPVQHSGMITPAGTIEDVLQQWHLYQELKNRIGTPKDFLEFTTKDGEKRTHPKKSFVRKVQRFFNISCDITQDEPLRDEKGNIIAWLAKARAVHLGTGAYQEADGSCSFEEKATNQRTIHNIRSHAITRAKNRAILDLVGFGEVSAEEIVADELEINHQPQQFSSQSSEPATQKQISKLSAVANQKGLTERALKAIIYHATKKTSRKDLTKQEASELIDTISKATKEKLTEIVNQVARNCKEQKEQTKPENTVLDVDPVTGEVTFSDDEIEDALGGGQNGNRS